MSTNFSMKLRVRINKQVSRVELEGPEPTLSDLSIRVREILLPSIGLSSDTEFVLSLNGKEPLVDTGQTLSSCGVVSGDLISVILPAACSSSNSPPAPSTSTETKRSAVRQQSKPQGHSVSVMQSSNDQAATSSSSSINRAGESKGDPRSKLSMMTGEEEEEVVGPFIPEPMLCCEAQQGKAPHSLEILFQAAQCRNSSECLLVAAHLLMLETGFLPQGDDIRAGEMPSGWRAVGGVFRLQYTHPHCENGLVFVVAVPISQTLVFNATLKTSSTVENAWKLVLKPSAYVTEHWTGGNAAAVYKDLPKLSSVFKDQLAYPLIAAARAALELPALFGLDVLPPELLLRVLRLLDVQSVLSLSSVCRHLYSASQDPMLWRHLLQRDFRVCNHADRNQRDTYWKELYQKRYKQKMEIARSRIRYYPYAMPPMHPQPPMPPVPLPLYPPGIIGGEYDQRLGIPHSILPRPRYDPIGPLQGQQPDIFFPFGRHLPGRGGSRGADIRRGFI